MFRIKLAMIIGGGFIAFMGFEEFKVSSGATAEAETVSLVDLEAGEVPENAHLAIGEHIALYGAAVYEYEQRDGETGEPGPNAKVNHCYFPIFSTEHPLFAVEEETADDDNFAVLVKTNAFSTIGAIPDDFSTVASVKGLVINRIESLDEEETNLVKQSFPDADLDNVLIIEQNREPASVAKSGGMMGGGALLSLVGLGLFFVGKKGGAAAV
jgi:hypothetical protein